MHTSIQHNHNKTVQVSPAGIRVTYTDTNKHFFYPTGKNPYAEQIQLHGTTRYQSLEHAPFNEIQQRLYGEAVYGLHYYTPKEFSKLSGQRILAIEAKHSKAQSIINVYKQEKAMAAANRFLMALFPKSRWIPQLLAENTGDDELENTMTFKELGITKHDIAQKLVEEKVLPQNFFKLSAA